MREVLLTTAEMAEADRRTIAQGLAGLALMEAAGAAVAERVQLHVPDGPVLILCGPGNNGGDGFVAARHLARRGRYVTVIAVASADALRGDAREACRHWVGRTLPLAQTSTAAEIERAAVIVDGLYGAGLTRPIEGPQRSLIEAVNTAHKPVIAIDLPSGINGSTGQVMGVAIRAVESVTFFRRKPGHLLCPGRHYCGEVHVADIGIRDDVLQSMGPQTFANTPALWRDTLRLPRPDDHKYKRGHAVVISGGIAATGAARLAARGALRVGAGLVTLATPASALAVNAAASTAVMVRPVDTSGELAALLADTRRNACIIGPGCGIGRHTIDLVEEVLTAPCAAVLDADVLTSFASHPDRLFRQIRRHTGAGVVLTPHEGEYAIIAKNIPGVSEGMSKVDRARLLARESGAVVLIKGPDTVVADPDGRAAIADNAPPYLATAGSGDVLAGFIGGLLAQGMPAFEAACAGVWLHGEAGHVAGPGLIAEDLPEALPAVLASLYALIAGDALPAKG